MTRFYLLCTSLILLSMTGLCDRLSTATADDWPQWQGPDRNAVSKETGLLQEWPKGRSAAGMEGDRDRPGDGRHCRETMDAFTRPATTPRRQLGYMPSMSLTANPCGVQRSDPAATQETSLSRSVPEPPPRWKAIDSTFSARMGTWSAARPTRARRFVRVNYVKDLGGIMPVWGFSESPLVDGDRIICTPGAPDGALMALDKRTGKPIWKCKVPEGPTGNRGFLGTSGAAYASAIAVDFEGVRQYVQLTATTLVGVAASDGQLLWRYDRASNRDRINCTTPLYHDGIVYAASAYDAGGGAVKLSKDASGAITAKEVFFSPRMKNHHGGMIIVDTCLYGAAGGNEGGFLNCLDAKTGAVLWSERQAPKGSLLLADGRLYLRTERGEMILIEPNRERFVERGRFQQPDRTREPAWTHPVIANGKLYVRDQDILFCYDIAKK